uniref:Uncharacterized protein n=1 Tax=Candidatus Methanophagaceae archaeon ANME-1 ERB6 TaxID=2759912 RepID=A0A7G9Z0J7_9EURY|nr:hypothetical protein JMICBFOL_00030 [Methanosarcinales archaeon ANME-1 ERB6]
MQVKIESFIRIYIDTYLWEGMNKGKNEGKKVKTSLEIDEDLWNKFSIAVIQKEGNKKKKAVIEKLIKQYVDTNKEG